MLGDFTKFDFIMSGSIPQWAGCALTNHCAHESILLTSVDIWFVMSELEIDARAFPVRYTLRL